ncbi:MAG: FAD-dependent thymidylate synthase [Oscillospiraceae bacterium]|nr:FAD-dependent thymidylate synthase [Oscillospiraceae bacterium]
MQVKLLSNQNIEDRAKYIAAAGKLSRFEGDVFDVLDSCEDYGKNLNLIKRITAMGHESIIDHDYFVFAIKDVSPIVEQLLIKERIVSFTIKSRREVDFSNAGFYVPSFAGREDLQAKYKEHMQYLFDSYAELLEQGVTREDARFVLPYCYYSNIIMGCDARVLKNIIIRFTKGKESAIAEVRELGEVLKKIAEESAPYLIDIIDNATPKFIIDKMAKVDYNIIDEVKLLSHTPDVDNAIITSSLMRTCQLDEAQAAAMMAGMDAEEYINEINEDFEQLDFTQVNFRFQIPISLAVLTHITRHRTHDILVPDFLPINNLEYFKTPPSIKNVAEFKEIFAKNKAVYDWFVAGGAAPEDLVYFHLSGNMVNIVTNMNGKALAWICRLRRCTKAQWEMRDIANQFYKLAAGKCEHYAKVLAPDCETKKFCGEGKESCGRLEVILNREKVAESA